MPSAMECCTIGKEADAAYMPKGQQTRIGTLDVYESNPPPNLATATPSRLLLLLPDGFGLAKHNFILADAFAAKGWRVIIPDYYEGDPLPIQHMRRNDPNLSEEDKEILGNIDLDKWLASHQHDHVEKLLREVTKSLLCEKRNQDMILNVAGYCFGGKHALRMAGWEGVGSVASFHPMYVSPEDVQELSCPTYIGLAELDEMTPPTLKTDLERWAGITTGFKSAVSLKVYPGVDHGFAARPDPADAVVFAQYTEAFDDTVEFFLSKGN